MAHRKPLGTTCHTNADWKGEKPVLGDYLVTPADTWYRIIGVEEKANPEKVGLLLERVARPQPWTKGRVHEFEWYLRDRRRAA